MSDKYDSVNECTQEIRELTKLPIQGVWQNAHKFIRQLADDSSDSTHTVLRMVTPTYTACTVQLDGSIIVWDLHESSSLNESYTDHHGNEFQLRQPTYNTGKCRYSRLTYLCNPASITGGLMSDWPAMNVVCWPYLPKVSKFKPLQIAAVRYL